MPIRFEPLEHQGLIVDWLKPRDEAAVFAGMGLGKTASALSALEYLFSGLDSHGVLVVAPLRVSVLTWPHEAKKWAQFANWRVVSLRTKEGRKAWESGEAEIYTINYESLPKICRELIHGKKRSQLPVDTIIFDELAEAKNPSSKRINTFRRYRSKFKRFWGLTGTPTPNGLIDIFAQVRLLDDGERLGKSHSHFRQSYFEAVNPFSDYPKFQLRMGMESVIEEKISDLAITLRSEDWLKIPPTTFEDVSVSLPKEAKKAYKELEKELLLRLEEDFDVAAVNAAVLANKLLQITGGTIYETPPAGEDGKPMPKRVRVIHDAKIEALKKVQREEPGPLLVGCWYKHERERILAAFPGSEVFREGETLERWNAGKIPLLVAHPKSIGHGLNLQDGGSRVVWFSLWWDQQLYDQLNARLARQGQKQETKVIRLIVPGTIDDAVAEAIRDKNNTQTGFLETLKNLQELARAKAS